MKKFGQVGNTETDPDSENFVFFSEYQVMDKVQKSSNINCNIQKLEPLIMNKLLFASD